MKRSLNGEHKQLQSSAASDQALEDGKPLLSTLDAPVSPPRRRSRNKKVSDDQPAPSLSSAKADIKLPSSEPSLAAIEAGAIEVTDHLKIFSSRLARCARPVSPQVPRLPIRDWVDLYERNLHPNGRHFVIHQHDHPIAGPHYDLRLQFSETSSVSWSIMYGLPGDPNSRRLNRNATETRVHCFWNHLIETASANTGSMIIWDTGEYEILPSQSEREMVETDDSRSELSDSSLHSPVYKKTESEKLREAFRNNKIRLRLHGTRLPENYTIILRLDKNFDFAKPSTRIPRKRRRRTIRSSTTRPEPSTSSDSDISDREPQDQSADADADTMASHSESESAIDHQIRMNNAYPGSTNTIGSIHQRRWFATLDRVNSGFVPEHDKAKAGSGKKRWVRKRNLRTGQELGFEPFYVRGPEVERSVVTGRLGKDVMEDEGVKDFVPRRGWRAVVE
ncbi:uncharacterized protein NFIA_107910 [Aspergillus fischeri NRRL 181]|uniref:DNA ligase D 3'-phosphoesterase domain-containing protein n=1 Tax=Neosartorya fischeri (strain ATCC 1020 / DSM 3700 / CBS 544.65 / FGSC A1164 / JCM 1740 / NRRL 181 / WB 181) TaxID=331117 RepID=A1CXE7_NEOFI|nr:conserved hypothetical protein [Aspergillus fischeri NRRL 181]EAW25299.1 conserved hypothetical protein [Aspergillus fischeri NRRL 181]